jgi:hypothetical protein
VRRLGVLLLAAGLAGFLYSSSRKSKAESLAAGSTVSSPGAQAAYRWETARWLIAGTAVIGLVFTILPGKRE